jgi:hypothetical protein
VYSARIRYHIEKGVSTACTVKERMSAFHETYVVPWGFYPYRDRE